MKISLNLQNKTGNYQKNNYNSNVYLAKQNFDSVSFQGKKSEKSSFLRRMMAFVLAFTPIFSTQARAAENKANIATEAPAPIVSQETENPLNTPIVIGNNYVYSPEELALIEDRDFQLRQTKDSPSITFDFTDNFKPKTFTPSEQMVALGLEDGEFANLNEIIDEIYLIKEDDKEIRYLIAQSILKANPELASYVTDGVVDYTKGDVTNIPVELMLSTDYAQNAESSLSIFLPEVNVLAERRNDTDSTLTTIVQFAPKSGNEDDLAVIQIESDDIKGRNTEAQINAIEKILAKEYDIETMQSYAGDAIWHGIAIWEGNKEVFAYASEQDTKSALVQYILENDTVSLELPRIDVSVIQEENAEIDAQNALTEQKDLGVTISYLTPEVTVYDLSQTPNHTIKPIDLFEQICFMDGTSLKEAYEENKDKYEGLILSAYRQIINNNNALLDVYGNETLKPVDLYLELDFSNLDEEDMKINLQPVAYAHPDCKLTCDEPKRTLPPSEPQKPEPTPPTPTPPDDDDEEEDCPDLPDIDVTPKPLPDDKPELDDPEPTTPPQEEDPFCPTEPEMPPTSEDDSVADDVVGGFEDEVDEAPQITPETPNNPPAEEEKPSLPPAEEETPATSQDPSCPDLPEVDKQTQNSTNETPSQEVANQTTQNVVSETSAQEVAAQPTQNVVNDTPAQETVSQAPSVSTSSEKANNSSDFSAGFIDFEDEVASDIENY